MRHLATISFLGILTAGCLGSQPVGPTWSAAPSQGYSSTIGDSVSSGSAVSVGLSRPETPSEIIVRPDLVEFAFVISATGSEPDELLPKIKERAEALFAQVKATVGAPNSKMCGTNVRKVHTSKLATPDAPAEYTIRVDGSVEVPLKPDQDYWARSRMMAQLAKLAHDVVAAEKAKEAPMEIGFSEPRLRVTDVEKYREKLLVRWMDRTKKLFAIAEAEKSPLAVVDCTPPGEIEQRIVSLEEIALSLPVSCRLGAPERPATP